MARTPSAERRSTPLHAAALTQAGATLLACVPLAFGLDLTAVQWAVLQGAAAMRIAAFAGAPPWWIGLHVVFAPAVLAAHSLALSPLVWAAAWAVTLLLFGATHRTRVPLFLTGSPVQAALAELIDPARSCRLIDLGCGLGGVVAALQRAHPQCQCHGVELAWLPYVISRVRAWRAGFRVERRDLMSVDLAPYDLVYAFLSPATMEALWEKARREMRPGSRLVSLAFPVPGVPAERVLAVTARARHRLYVWTM